MNSLSFLTLLLKVNWISHENTKSIYIFYMITKKGKKVSLSSTYGEIMDSLKKVDIHFFLLIFS